MVAPTVGAIVLVQFPFSDLSKSKLRPAVVLADAGRGDWILCQITSKPYGDRRAVELNDASFSSGSLRTMSYARPGKLFTANRNLMVAEIGKLKYETLTHVIDVITEVLGGERRGE
jgi:mRNA interferase MazF